MEAEEEKNKIKFLLLRKILNQSITIGLKQNQPSRRDEVHKLIFCMDPVILGEICLHQIGEEKLRCKCRANVCSNPLE